MQKLCLSLCCILILQGAGAQNTMPSYPTVVKAFQDCCEATSSAENSVVFAKKKDGWYLQHINRLQNDKVLQEVPFWSVKENGYIDTKGMYLDPKPGNKVSKIKEYLSDGMNSWYDYERCRYYGYNGWADDIIKDYGGKALDNDTLYESLARAYSNKALSYLWYQVGGQETDNDPLKQQLQPLERPSKERIEKVKENIKLAIATYALLEKRNPAYQTKVGNIRIKRINEVMYGYNQMMMAGDVAAAKQFVDGLEADDSYINQAKNYLSSCAPNSILFTYGDNDTYPLWYVQQKLGFRKDVTVINNSLMGLPIYIKTIRDNKEATLSIPNPFINARNNDYYLFQQDAKAPKELSIKAFIAGLVAGKQVEKTTNGEGDPIAIRAYNTQKINFIPGGTAFAPLVKQGFAVQPFSISLRSYLFLNDLVMLDIIANNINTRPIYFSSSVTHFFDDYLITEGICKRLVPFTNTAKQKYTATAVKNLEQYVNKTYRPLTPVASRNDGSYAADEEFYFAAMVDDVVQYYAAKDEQAKAAAWMDKAIAISPGFDEAAGVAGITWGQAHFKAGNVAKGTKVLEQYGQRLFNFYQSPSALYQMVTMKDCDEMFNYLNGLISNASGKASAKINELLKRSRKSNGLW